MRGLSYAYTNSLVIAVFLNPVALFVAYHSISHNSGVSVVDRAGLLCAIGSIAFLVTTLRPFRFLGEPERYLEAVTPFGALYLSISFGIEEIWVLPLLLYQLLLIGVQMIIVNFQLKHTADNNTEVYHIARKINAIIEPRTAVRFCCNNEEVTKLLMGNPWSFFRLWAGGQIFAGKSFGEVCHSFPFIDDNSTKLFARHYKANVALVDKQSPGCNPDSYVELGEVFYSSDRFVAYKIA